MNPLVSILSWRPRTPFYYGWLILAVSALGTFVATGVSQVVLAGIQEFIFEDTRWTRSTIALGVSIGTWSGGLLTPFVGRLADRYGPRWMMPAGMVLVGISLFSLAGVDSVWQFYAAYILGRAISNPVLIGVVPRTTAVNFFRRRRNLALALTGMSRPLGGAVNIQLISAIAGASSWRRAYRYLGVLSLLLVLPVVLVLRRRPEDIGLQPDGEAPRAQAEEPASGRSPESGGGRTGHEVSWTAGQAVRTRAFWLVVSTAAMSTLGASTSASAWCLILEKRPISPKPKPLGS